MRGWSNDKADEVFARSAGAGGSDGAHASARAPFTVGGDLFDRGEDRPPVQAMTRFIDEHRGVYGVEPNRRVRQKDRGLAGVELDADGLRAGRAGAGVARATAR